MSHKTMRIAIDASMTVAIILAMFIQFTGTLLHEIIGFLLLFLLIAHLVLSAKWIKAVAKKTKAGELKGRLKSHAIMALLLFVDLLVLAVSSVAISTILAGAGLRWTLGSYDLWLLLHTISSYGLCILVLVHLAMHWAFIASVVMVQIPYDPSRRQAIATTAKTVAAVGAVALGVVGVTKALPEVKAMGNAGGSSGSSSGSSESGAQSGAAQGSEARKLTKAGICPLCSKRCQLSAPDCSRPYREGLI